MAKKNKKQKTVVYKGYTCRLVDKWVAPEEGGAPILTMPNVPHPLHNRAPRTIVGTSTWNHMRNRCYFEAGYKCEACGAKVKTEFYDNGAVRHQYHDDGTIPKRSLHCLEPGTEVMTVDGFKPIEDIAVGDVVAQFNKDTRAIEWVHPSSTVKTKVDKLIMIGYKNRFKVGYSDRHRMLIEHTVNKGNKGHEQRVEYQDKYPEELSLNGSNRIITAGKALCTQEHLTPLERIYIAMNADGSVQYQSSDGKYYVLFRAKKECKKERFKQLLIDADITYTTPKDSRDGYESYACRLDVNPKDFWDSFDITELGYEKAKEFIDELVKWDGWEGMRKSGSGKSFDGRCWFTTKQDQADFVQMVATLAGLTTTVSITERKERKWSETMVDRRDSTDCKPQINIEFLNKTSRGVATMQRTVEEYDGYVYCITVPSTYFVARSKDKYVFVTGNCHELYSYDYNKGTAKFERGVALCEECHVRFIHSGRMLTMYKKGDPLMSAEAVLEGIEHGFKQVYQWNKDHYGEEKLRVYYTIVDYVDDPTIGEKIKDLIKKYKIEFYMPDGDMFHKGEPVWNGWKLVIGDKEYPSLFSSRKEWEEAMERNNKEQLEKRTTWVARTKKFDSIDSVDISEEDMKKINDAELPEGF